MNASKKCRRNLAWLSSIVEWFFLGGEGFVDQQGILLIDKVL